jgi:hypothetical protein
VKRQWGLGLAVLGGVALLVYVNVNDARVQTDGAPATSVTSPSPSTSAAATPQAEHVDDHEVASPTRGDHDGSRAALEVFLAAYLADVDDPQAWFADVEPMLAPDLAEGMRWTDPRNVVDGPAVAVERVEFGLGWAVYEVTAPSGSFDVALGHDGQQWRVVEVGPA